VPLVKAVQELSKQNEDLNLKVSQFENLKMENQELKSRLEKLEAVVFSKQLQPQSVELTIVPRLEQNIPNPFTNSTTIHYTLPEKSLSAKIIITNKNGKMLKEVRVSGSGKGSINVNAAMFSSGTYQYSLIIDGKMVDTKQMILIR